MTARDQVAAIVQQWADRFGGASDTGASMLDAVEAAARAAALLEAATVARELPTPDDCAEMNSYADAWDEGTYAVTRVLRALAAAGQAPAPQPEHYVHCYVYEGDECSCGGYAGGRPGPTLPAPQPETAPDAEVPLCVHCGHGDGAHDVNGACGLCACGRRVASATASDAEPGTPDLRDRIADAIRWWTTPGDREDAVTAVLAVRDDALTIAQQQITTARQQTEDAKLQRDAAMARVRKLEKRDAWLDALEAAGVDNWQGFDHARELFNEGDT